ncbi:MAG: phosphoribosylglycinamide formyltransferase [Clostridiales bacterium]|nr:phosphoribosylglycinamide formyltransferase [Clostridiales bacterium]
MKKNIAVFVSGGGTDFQSIIDGVKAEQINAVIKLLISSKDGVYALQRAKNNGIPFYVFKKSDYLDADSLYGDIDLLLKENNIDVIILAGYLSIVPKSFVAKYYGRIINVHPSLIPKHCGMGYYGMKVHEAVLASGDKISGATVHFVDEGADTGAVILQKEIPVMNGDTKEALQERVLQAEHEILPRAVGLICADKVKLSDGKAVFCE